ncbi:MAG: acetyl-CoA carboxylase biotin carboxyl carrier protein [Steroidobacteraceae bacterium]
MSLTGADVAQILRLLESSSFDELELEMNGVKLSLRRSGAAVAPPPEPQPAIAIQPATAPQAATSAVAAAGDDGEAVTAPLLGTFYRSPKPGAPPYVEVGSLVEADTVIAIVEVMKLMNSVRAGRRGRVTAILAEDGALVEYGQPLLRIAGG